MAYERIRIIKKYLILCEGMDTMRFVIEYLASKTLMYDKRFDNDIQALDFGGIDNLRSYLGNLMRMEGFDSVHHILILRDAETDVQKAERMVKTALDANQLPVPERPHEWQKEETPVSSHPAIAFTLMPSCNQHPTTGALEDLCWSILKGANAEGIRADVQGFIDIIKQRYGTVSTHEHKSRLHAYFSVNEKYISMKIGEAARAGAFDWTSDKLAGLKELIAEGLE